MAFASDTLTLHWEEPQLPAEAWPRRRAQKVAEELGPWRGVAATVLTLVVWVDPTAPPQPWEDLAHIVVQRHPCRTVVVVPDPSPIAACPVSVEVTLKTRRDAPAVLFSECLSLRPGGSLAHHWLDLVQPWILPDLPAYLWWVGAPPPLAFPWELVAAGFTHFVLDSATTPLTHWRAALWRAWDQALRVEDLQWQRLLPWRQALADAADDPRGRACLREPETVTASWPAASVDDLTLAVAWLAARLRWPPAMWVPAIQGARTPQPMVSIRQDTTTVSAVADIDQVRCTLRREGDTPRTRTYPRHAVDTVEALLAVLGRGHDPVLDEVFEAVLPVLPGAASAKP
ncbi:MAG: glucose-6-phosphate dehydrogenase assembly protein OpcA [Firmicutes bacterium]|nr:glucose-6-phosphate dehydrogenase assembly protein OpcA [Alicyclobacillaceae bacterium]MCL6496562.1 glucose-6-phosphate dehydrogenase assembly protein OpcA [Bacillota bacterium]